MSILNYAPVSTSGSYSSSLINIGVVLKCTLLFLQLISLSIEQERHNNDSLQIYLPKSASNVQNSYSLISSFTKLLPKTSNKTSPKNISLAAQPSQEAEGISSSYYVLLSTPAAPDNVSDYLTNTDPGATPERAHPPGPHHNSTLRELPSDSKNPRTSSQSSIVNRKNVNNTLKSINNRKLVNNTLKNVDDDYDLSDFNKRSKQPSISHSQNVSLETTTRGFNYFPELNSSQDLYIDYKLPGEYNSSSSNYSLYPDGPIRFNSSNTTLSEEPLADILILGGLSVLLGVMILVTVIGKLFLNVSFTS